ncbi:LysM domain protein [Aspergillus udagawae]|uniref:LysM domain protein n=1 Tax=Aspergillus udagawae TaxID=91492 RepID=A0A8H3N2X1_9EURO|nr:LysM domain protein [Aspergillus udagawae]
MGLTSILIVQILFLSAANSAVVKRWPSSISPTGPTDPSVAKTCGYWVNDVAKNDQCTDLEEYFDISREELVNWNPSLKENCRLQIGHSYCVAASELTMRSVYSAEEASRMDMATVAEAADLPYPTQGGLAANCNAFYKVNKGDSCWSIINNFGNFSIYDFYRWNPSVGHSCEALYPDYYVCIGVQEEETPVATPTNPPGPVLSGTPANCNKYHKVVPGDNCWAIANQYGISLDQFYLWNPAVKPTSCQSLLPDYYVCVGVAGIPSYRHGDATTDIATDSSTAAVSISWPANATSNAFQTPQSPTLEITGVRDSWKPFNSAAGRD